MTSFNTNNQNQSTTQQWISVFSLAFAAFIFCTTEFIPIALLSDIAHSFHMQSTQVGIMITVYAWVVAITSLPIMLLTKNIERRFLLICIFIIFILSHVLSYFSWNFYILLISRIGIALAHALFWSITASLVMRVAPQDKKFQALSILSAGTVLATVLGIPLGRIIGDIYSWRDAFAVMAVCATIICIILAKTLPLLPSVNSGSLSSLKILGKRISLMLIYALTVIIISAQFTAYSYIEPFSLKIANLSSSDITVLLLIFGGSGFVGSYLFGKYAQRLSKIIIPLSASIMVLSLFLLLVSASNIYTLFILCVFWSIAMTCLGLSLQAKVLHLASDATDVAMAIYSGLFNVGIGAGALFGGIVTVNFGLQYIGFVGGGLAVIGLLLILVLIQRADFLNPEINTEKDGMS